MTHRSIATLIVLALAVLALLGITGCACMRGSCPRPAPSTSSAITHSRIVLPSSTPAVASPALEAAVASGARHGT